MLIGQVRCPWCGRLAAQVFSDGEIRRRGSADWEVALGAPEWCDEAGHPWRLSPYDMRRVAAATPDSWLNNLRGKRAA